MHKFKVWYADGETYVGAPENAPKLGVALIIERDQNHGRRFVGGEDFYIWNPVRECWIPGDKYTKQYYEEKFGWIWLAGVMMHLEDYCELWKLAENDPDFPKRTAYYANEPRQPILPGD